MPPVKSLCARWLVIEIAALVSGKEKKTKTQNGTSKMQKLRKKN